MAFVLCELCKDVPGGCTTCAKFRRDIEAKLYICEREMEDGRSYKVIGTVPRMVQEEALKLDRWASRQVYEEYGPIVKELVAKHAKRKQRRL